LGKIAIDARGQATSGKDSESAEASAAEIAKDLQPRQLLLLMKYNVILEASRADAREGDISKWHGATLLNGGYTVCLRRLEKTLSVTVRDGTNGWCRGGGRARSPAIAQSPNAAPAH
jgi:hypothetical protein